MACLLRYLIAIFLVDRSLQNGMEEPRYHFLNPHDELINLDKDSQRYYIVYRVIDEVINHRQKLKAIKWNFEQISTKQTANLSKLEQRLADLEKKFEDRNNEEAIHRRTLGQKVAKLEEGLHIRCSERYTSFNLDGDGNAVYLDRQFVRCMNKEYLSSFRLERNTNFTRIRYKYTCCSIE